MSAFAEMFELTKTPDMKMNGMFRPFPQSFSRRSNRARRDNKVFKEWHKQYKQYFDKNDHYYSWVTSTTVPVKSIDYFQGWMFTKKLLNAQCSQFIAFTKDEAKRMFRELVDWKHLPVTNDHETFISWDMFPETFFDIQKRVNDMLDKFEEGKTFIVFSY